MAGPHLFSTLPRPVPPNTHLLPEPHRTCTQASCQPLSFLPTFPTLPHPSRHRLSTQASLAWLNKLQTPLAELGVGRDGSSHRKPAVRTRLIWPSVPAQRPKLENWGDPQPVLLSVPGPLGCQTMAWPSLPGPLSCKGHSPW